LIGKKFKCIYTSNVLEHIDDDLDALIKLGRLLQPQGKLAIYTPALPFLFSNLDYQAGHFRRYRKQELISKVQLAGFKVEKCFYNDSLGVIASLVLKVVGYRNKFGLGHGKSLIIYDRFFYPISQVLDALGMRFLGGKNLFLFAVKN
jgi:SAM-dependent methyltransferase